VTGVLLLAVSASPMTARPGSGKRHLATAMFQVDQGNTISEEVQIVHISFVATAELSNDM